MTEMGSPCNENGEYKNWQKNNRMDAIFFIIACPVTMCNTTCV